MVNLILIGVTIALYATDHIVSAFWTLAIAYVLEVGVQIHKYFTE